MSTTVVSDQTGLTAALAAMGSGDEIQLRGGTYATPAAGNYVPATGAGGLIRPYPGDEGLVVCSAAAAADTWRVHGAVELRDLVSEAAGAGNDCYALNTTGCKLVRVRGRGYTSRCVYSTSDSQELDGVVCEGSGGDTAIELTGAGNVVTNPVVTGTHANGIRARGTVLHPTIAGCSGRALECDQAVAVRNTILAGNPGIGAYLNHASADVDYVHFYGNGTDSQVLAGALGGHVTTGDPLFTDSGSGDYSLQVASPCKDQGADVGVTNDANGDPRPAGAGPDLGAYEVQSVPPRVVSAAYAGNWTDILVTFDQAMDAGHDLTTAAAWGLSAPFGGDAAAVVAVVIVDVLSVLLTCGRLGGDTLYAVVAPAAVENAAGDPIESTAREAHLVTPAYAEAESPDVWAATADGELVDVSGVPFELVPWSAAEPATSLRDLTWISLFSDRRADPADVLPDPSGDPPYRGGWWGDSFDEDGEDGDDQFGSRLWLLARGVVTDSTVARAQNYVVEALAWMARDGLVARTDVEAERFDHTIAMTVRHTRQDGSAETVRYADLWDPWR